MEAEKTLVGRGTAPKDRPGSPVAKPGEYLFDPAHIEHWRSGPDYSPSVGCYVIGERIILGLQTAAAGTDAKSHSHRNEQWMYILEGEAEMTVADQTFMVRAGQIVYIPAETVHSVRVTSKMALRFLAAKDTRGDVSATNWDDQPS